jgi:hypothetical protein
VRFSDVGQVVGRDVSAASAASRPHLESSAAPALLATCCAGRHERPPLAAALSQTSRPSRPGRTRRNPCRVSAALFMAVEHSPIVGVAGAAETMLRYRECDERDSQREIDPIRLMAGHLRGFILSPFNK